jgi:hypothetical protein
MAYRSRNQDIDQEIARRINDSYRYAKRPHQPDPKAQLAKEVGEIMRRHPGMTFEEAIDEEIKAQLAELAGATPETIEEGNNGN